MGACALALIACVEKAATNGKAPLPGRVDPSKHYLYVVNVDGLNAIDIADLASAPIKLVGCNCLDGTSSGKGILLSGLATVYAYDPATEGIEKIVDVPGGVITLASDGKQAGYALSRNPSGVAVFDMQRLHQGTFINTSLPSAISVSPSGDVAIAFVDAVRVYTPDLKRVVRSIPIGAADTQLAYDSEGSLVVVAGSLKTYNVYDGSGKLLQHVDVDMNKYSALVLDGTSDTYIVSDEKPPCAGPGKILMFKRGDTSPSRVYEGILRIRSAAVAGGALYTSEQDCEADGPDVRVNVYDGSSTQPALRFTGLGGTFKLFFNKIVQH